MLNPGNSPNAEIENIFLLILTAIIKIGLTAYTFGMMVNGPLSLVAPLLSHFKIDPGGNVLACDHHRELPRSGGWFDCVSTIPTCII